MYILGLSGHHHHAAAAMIKDGQVIAAIEEEKLLRIRHVGIKQCGGLPYSAIRFCLAQTGIGIEQVDSIAYYLDPHRLLRRQLQLNSKFAHQMWLDSYGPNMGCINEFHDRLRTHRLVDQLSGNPSKLVSVDHQMAHAASSFYLSGFDRAAVLVLNGRGDMVTIAMGLGEGRKIRFTDQITFPISLGWIYSSITKYLGYRAAGGEDDTQWLSTTGELEFFPAFCDLLRLSSKGLPTVDLSYFSTFLQEPDPFSEKFYRRFGDHLRHKGHWPNGSLNTASWPLKEEHLYGKPKLMHAVEIYRRNLARSLQVRIEQIVIAIAEKLRKDLGVDALCIAGGVALNVLIVSKLELESGYRHIFAQPAAGNAGCSVGAALSLWHGQLGQGTPSRLEHIYWGPEYTDQDIKPVIDNCKLHYCCFTTDEKLLGEVAELLYRQNIVAWFQGRAEFGPRSLGARSILASPQSMYMIDNLNNFVKHRESFRPFAASMPEEDAAEYFKDCSPLSPFLLSVSEMREDKRHLIPAGLFANGLARVHKVSRRTNPLFWRLLQCFREKAGIPILLNTSFSLYNEPIVCAPREAVRSFYCSGIDALVLNRFLLQK